MNLDAFFERTYSPAYTCFEFAGEVWEYLTGQDIKEAFALVKSRSVRRLAGSQRLENPVSPCICILRGVRRIHCGVYIEGGILQLTHDGVMWLPEDVLLNLGYSEAGYYAVNIH